MIHNPIKSRFLRNTRRVYKQMHLSRRLHDLIREFAPRHSTKGQELIVLLSQYESLLGTSSETLTQDLSRLSSQMHQKLNELAPYLGSEKQELLEVMTELEALYPHLYQRA
jgi:hypothetical protein